MIDFNAHRHTDFPMDFSNQKHGNWLAINLRYETMPLEEDNSVYIPEKFIPDLWDVVFRKLTNDEFDVLLAAVSAECLRRARPA